jgi:hypothetical protein
MLAAGSMTLSGTSREHWPRPSLIAYLSQARRRADVLGGVEPTALERPIPFAEDPHPRAGVGDRFYLAAHGVQALQAADRPLRASVGTLDAWDSTHEPSHVVIVEAAGKTPLAFVRPVYGSRV